eukprot:TRINITY_DN44747_c0_g1_i1.p2 TRINITY_DN44747_c0_g1~~TRINITY_DN44747_c0_g1_i1.p2  ORF type:complete len:298 (-),score=92.79 TRINITY_DN44747_c0_g1_i1:149-1042(-)
MGCGGSKAPAPKAAAAPVAAPVAAPAVAPKADKAPALLTSSAPPQPTEATKPAEDAALDNKLKALFDALSKDDAGAAASAELFAALKSVPDELVSQLDRAHWNPASYAVHELEVLPEGSRVAWETFSSLFHLPMKLAEGQLAKVKASGEVAKVLKRTTTDIQLEMPDRSVQWVEIEDVRMAHEQPKKLAQLEVGDSAKNTTTGEAGTVIARTTTDVKVEMPCGNSKWHCITELEQTAAAPAPAASAEAATAATATAGASADRAAVTTTPLVEAITVESGATVPDDVAPKGAMGCFSC